MTPETIPLSLYIHWPWCVKKCPYCDFNSHALPTSSGSMTESYLSALKRDLLASTSYTHHRALQSIFIGGGTPSLMKPQEIEDLLNFIAQHYRLSSECEITMEANPGTLDNQYFADYKSAGINRLSMGIQSFDDTLLTRLGRIHRRAEALKSIELAQNTFDNFNLDVMFALPGQSLAMLENDLACATQAGSTHLSFYQLTIEPNTYFAKYEPEDLPDEDTAAVMQETVIATLAEHGFERYEISGYAKTGHRCRHNLNYWQFGDYLAAGAGAHGKVTLADGTIIREARYSQPTSFISHATHDSAVVERREVESDELPFEFMLNALRLIDGVEPELFLQRTGLDLDTIQDTIRQAQRDGLMPEPLTRIQATEKGTNFLSVLQERFL